MTQIKDPRSEIEDNTKLADPIECFVCHKPITGQVFECPGPSPGYEHKVCSEHWSDVSEICDYCSDTLGDQ